jgi:hypothetical protein
MTPEHEAQIIALCERIGMPWERAPERKEPWFGWNGVLLNVSSRAGASGVVHEIAHWLIAPLSWRGLPGFGLGWKDIARGRRRPTEHIRFVATAEDEECAASLLGILIERKLGMSWRDTWSKHGWDDEHGPGRAWHARRWLRALQEHGHLRGLTPTCLLDATSSAPHR